MRRAWPIAAAVAGVLMLLAAHWKPRTGFTGLIGFGETFAERRLPALFSVPIATVPGSGYDGQFYAQLAVSPHPGSPDVQAALDNVPYRARRILLSWTAHLLGDGDPGITLQVFALQNLVLWLALGWLIWGELAPASAGRAAVAWLACMLTLGALDSVRMALTDLAAVFFLAAAIRFIRDGRTAGAVAALALAGLTRETSLLGGALLGAKSSRIAAFALAAAPLLLWTGWLGFSLPRGGAIGQGNFDWPGVAFARHCALCLGQMRRGDFDSRYLCGLLGGLGLAWQSLDLLLRPRWSEAWWRAGAGFAVLFWFLGDAVWSGYWAAARAVLPMTFAFNLLAVRERKFGWRIAGTNAVLVLHGVWRLIP